MNIDRRAIGASILTLVLGGAATTAAAQEVTLKAVNAFNEGTYYARNFERFVKKVNDEGKGIVQINYLGGPKAIPTMEQGAALRNGVVDLANTTTSFLASVAPESLSVNYATLPWGELRKNGAVDYLNKTMLERGLYYYARTGDGVPYHIYLNKKIEKADLSGLKIRIAPIYREFFTKLGATVVQIPPGEVFTALDRGVVDGYGWPLLGIFDLGWHEKTKFRVDPGFYNIELGIVFGAKAWNALTPAQKAFLEKQVAWVEGLNADMSAKDAPADIKRQADAGIQVIKLSDAEAKRFLQVSMEAGWAGVAAAAPAHAAKLRELMAPAK
ncbi:MAG: TRAP transporter substrate-binding protein DctP [Rubrivivax sp.]|nr:TRAP transporter substrate-binding protein DctP [Rubrivivax sp.]